MAAQYHLNRGTPKNSLTAEATVGAATGEEFGVIAHTGDGPGGETVRWTTSFSVAPATVNVVLEGSPAPNAVAPIWFTMDTSTNVNGESREVTFNVRGVRVRKTAQTGAGAITASILI